jgi:hypothetical protein
MGDEFSEKFGNEFNLQFGVLNAVTNKTNEDLALADVGLNTSMVMPKSGSVIGIGVKASANVTAGTVSFAAHKDGTEFAQSGFPNPTLNSTAGTSNETYATIRPGVLVFSADEAIGVSYTSSTDAAPTDSNDYSVTLYYQLDPN